MFPGLRIDGSTEAQEQSNNKIANVNEMAFYFPLIAIGAGAKLIEKHIVLDRTKAWEDYESAITANEFIKGDLRIMGVIL